MLASISSSVEELAAFVLARAGSQTLVVPAAHQHDRPVARLLEAADALYLDQAADMEAR